jgi:hypothetical protein
MPKNTKSRTSSRNSTKKPKFPKWVIAIVLLLITGTGLYLVYTSLASSSTDSRIGDSTPSYATLYCRRSSSSPNGWICIRHREQGYVAKSVVLQGDSSCITGIKFRLAGALKGAWGCVAISV